MTARVPLACLVLLAVVGATRAFARDRTLDTQLRRVLDDNKFTGTIGQPETLEDRLGRPLDTDLVALGNLLFFDKVLGLHDDHSCVGCHGPTNGFGDSQSISIGIRATRPSERRRVRATCAVPR
jgi:cytochrome c peroxidase